jgi:preprotein translocase subunit SecF
LHDAFAVLGLFSILGRLFGIELESTFIVAVLTVIGFSVHDSIVVFDRVRENLLRRAGEPFEDIVNHSIVQTLTRSPFSVGECVQHVCDMSMYPLVGREPEAVHTKS